MVWDVWISTMGSPIDNLKWVSSLEVKHPQILLGDIVLSHGWIWGMGKTLWDTPIKNQNILSSLQCKLGICSCLIKWNGNYWFQNTCWIQQFIAFCLPCDHRLVNIISMCTFCILIWVSRIINLIESKIW